ncbi:MAG: hypothetical protein F2590_03560 [Actinobacteria bacterium]|uniref:Unannotated protein n=1 Tax=freshwater metagenome TaxID=449393 RepID=A0A6J6HRQ2_9ZZZZ|nr:hypothetical protein [Actinomycetota bacterium]
MDYQTLLIISFFVTASLLGLATLIWLQKSKTLPSSKANAETISTVSSSDSSATSEDAPTQAEPLPVRGLLVSHEIMQNLTDKQSDIKSALEFSSAPVAVAYMPVTRNELARFVTVPVNQSMQQAVSQIAKAVNRNNDTLYKVILPKGAELVKAAGKSGFRAFAKNGSKISSHAVLKPVAIGGAAAISWPVLAVGATVMALDMVAQKEQRAFQGRVLMFLERMDETNYLERIKDQQSADAQLTRAISLMLDGRNPMLELALKSADEEYLRSALFIQKHRNVFQGLVDDDGKVDFRRLEVALGGKQKDVENFIREINLARSALVLKNKALVADAASQALAEPENAYAAYRKFLERETRALGDARDELEKIGSELSAAELKGRWYDKPLEKIRSADKSVESRQSHFRKQLHVPEEDGSDELAFIISPTGEVRQVVSAGSGDQE